MYYTVTLCSDSVWGNSLPKRLRIFCTYENIFSYIYYVLHINMYQRFHMDSPPRVSPLVRLILGRDQPYARGKIHMKTLVYQKL